MVNRPLHLCIETWNATLVKRWVEVASKEEILEAIDVPSPVGTALCMAAALKKEHEKGNCGIFLYHGQQI
jgi:E3 ubiquitin-protein ligase KEG